MPLVTKSLAETQKKWGEITPTRQAEYEANAIAAGPLWEANTLASAANYGASIRSANIEARHSAGVRRVGSAKYTRKLRAVGARRFGEGVPAAIQDFGTGFGPYLQTIQGVDVPQRRSRGDPGNIQRVTAVTNALHARRLATASAG